MKSECNEKTFIFNKNSLSATSLIRSRVNYLEIHINIHIIQCDADIQEDKIITTQKELDDYIRTIKLHGFGGTDFRPVFDYVDELINNKSFNNLKGMLYFTDGYGVFPNRKPDYTVAFVFVRDDYEVPEVPGWAIKMVLQKEDIYNI